MTVEVGGAGTVGLGLESTLGTYVTPTKWIPVRNETLQLMEDKVYRMNIRGVADRTGAIQGYTHTEGDVVFEVSTDILVYFFYLSRVSIVKTGAGPYTYVFTGAHVAKASTVASGAFRRTASLLVARSSNPRGYTGLSVGQMAFTIDNGVLVCTASMVGVDETTQSAGTPSYPAQNPFGPGEITLEVPTASARADADTFTCTINDNLVPANRLNGLRKAAYQNWGEREITMSMDYDFDTLTDFNAFTAQTLQAISLKAINTVSVDDFVLVLNASVTDSHQVNLSALGDVVRGAVAYHGIYNATDAVTATIHTAESIT